MVTGSDVAVVGAGPAGLAAAWRLVSGGSRVTLYDLRRNPGGRMRTAALEDARVDVAVQLLGSYYRETFGLASAVGAADLLVRSPGRDALWRRGRAHPLTYGSVTSMVGSGALPGKLKLRLAARYLPFLNRHAGALDANRPVSAAEAGLDAESLAAWGLRELGDGFVELLGYPLLAAYYGGTPEETSAGFYHALARAGLDVAVHAVRGGMGVLAERIVGELERAGARFRGGVGVEAAMVRRDGVALSCGGGETASHEAVVVAVSAPGAARLLEPRAPVRHWLAGVRTAPAASLALLLDRPVAANYFGLSFPRNESPGDRVAAVCIQERKAPGLVPDGKGVLVVLPAPGVRARVIELGTEDALAFLLPALERAFPGLDGRILAVRNDSFPEGSTVFYPGYLEHLRRFDPSALPARVALAGDYLVAPTVEGAVRSGIMAAERLLGRTESRQSRW